VQFRAPTIEDRVSVIGSTGEGKTQFSVWLLSIAHFDRIPYIIWDYKREPLIAEIRAKEIGLNEKLPSKPGLYVLRPDHDEHEAAENYLGKIYAAGNIGNYFDEAYMLPNSGIHGNGYLRAIYTQGRTKKIPAITLTQQPAHILSFAFSEAQHRAVFYLNRPRDRKTISEYFPENVDFKNHLPKYHSWWYSSGDRKAIPLAPVPGAEELLDRIDSRLAPKETRRIL
jgi:hypothetical protein